MLVTISRCPATLLAPHMPAGMAVRCWGWSRITWKGRLVSCSSHCVTAATSLDPSLLSRSRETMTSTRGSSSGRNLHTIPNTAPSLPSLDTPSTAHRSSLMLEVERRKSLSKMYTSKYYFSV